MLTKLTRTILAHDQELKVRRLPLVSLMSCQMLILVARPQKTWESLTPMGRVSGPAATLFAASVANCRDYRWASLKTLLARSCSLLAMRHGS